MHAFKFTYQKTVPFPPHRLTEQQITSAKFFFFLVQKTSFCLGLTTKKWEGEMNMENKSITQWAYMLQGLYYRQILQNPPIT